MEKNVGLSFDATMTVAEAKNKMHVPFVSKNLMGGKLHTTVDKPNGFIKRMIKKMRNK